jgi:hypothetical protein
VEPHIVWLPDPQVLDPEPSTVLQVLRPMDPDSLRIFLFHHPSAECYGVFYEFGRAEPRLARLGRLAGSLLGVPPQQLALVPADGLLLTLMQRPPELQLVDEFFRPMARVDLPGPDPARCANLAMLLDNRGVLLAFAWSREPEEEIAKPIARPADLASAVPQP